MILSQHDSRLLNPLLLRAKANRHDGFADGAASALAQQLGLEARTELSAQEQQEIKQCHWVDNKVQRYLNQQPEAITIELNAGVNTRFHRLSAAHEWPKFRWADVNLPDTHAFSQTLLPITDNYRQIGCDIWNDDWLYRTGWSKGKALLLVIEDLNLEHDQRALNYLLDDLCQRVGEFELITTWKGKREFRFPNAEFFIQQKACFTISQNPMIARCAAWLGYPAWQGLHARFTPH